MTIWTDLGIVTAYGNAVEAGYTGTKEEFGKLLADILNSSEQIKKNQKNITETATETGILKEKVEELSGKVGNSLTEEEVSEAVNTYLKENIPSLIPDNVVLFEEDDEEETITPEKIIEAVIEKMELKAVDDQTLGLYINSRLINSVKLEEFKTFDVICTGITITPTHVTKYGKTEIELIAEATPSDCTQKVRWFTTDEKMATVSDGTVSTTGKQGTVTIYAVCGNYRAECLIEIEAYVYPEVVFQIGEISETVGSAYARTVDAKKMRISSDYIKTPVDTIITMTGGSSYFYQLYKYYDDKLISFTAWNNCTGTIQISAEECSGVAIKIRKSNYGTWTDDETTAFAGTVKIEGA